MKLYQLLETPIPDADQLNQYSTTPGNSYSIPTIKPSLDFQGTKKKFDAKLKTIGYGSSRFAFLAPVDVKLFKAEDLESIDVNQGSAQTVIKVAYTSRGLAQNLEELKIWKSVKQHGWSKFFCPILDWAGNPEYKNDVKYVIDINKPFEGLNGNPKAPFWIQFGLATQFKSVGVFKAAFEKTFGIKPSDDSFEQLFDNNFIPDSVNHEQRALLTELKIAIEELGIAAQDLVEYENWGMYKNRLVMIDYGLTDQTEDLYSSAPRMLKVSIENGEVTIK